MSVIDDLVPLLKKLRLSGVLQSLELRLREAVDDSLSYEEFVYRLMNDEVEELYDLIVRSTPVAIVDRWEGEAVG